jgi:NarL family two-component system response regulator LiaR
VSSDSDEHDSNESLLSKQYRQSYSNREIGERIQLSERTVAKHTSNILDKLHVANRTQAALYALRKGIANLEVE